MGPAVERGVVLGVGAAVGEVVLADEEAAGDVLHAVEQVVSLVDEVQRAEVLAAREREPPAPPVPGDAEALVGEGGLELRERVAHGRSPEVREVGVEPDDLVVGEADVAGEMLYVLLREHVREDEARGHAQCPERPRPVRLGVLHAARRPADSEVEAVDHARLPRGTG